MPGEAIDGVNYNKMSWVLLLFFYFLFHTTFQSCISGHK